MRTGRLPLDEQLRVFQSTLEGNETLVEVLRRAARLDLPGWYVAAGCLYQTVWNVLSGRPAGQGIKEKFGVACVPYGSTEAAIDTFPGMACCVGVRTDGDGRWSVYAPYGLSDVFNRVVRPNPVQTTREVYEAKAGRWRSQWPDLTVLAWPCRVP